MLSSQPLVFCFVICRHDTSQANGGTIAHPQHQHALNALNNSLGHTLNVPSSVSPSMPSMHPKHALNMPPTRPQHALSAPSQCTSVPCPSCLPSVHTSFWMHYSFLCIVLGCNPMPLVLRVVLGQHVTRSLLRVIIARFLLHVVIACHLLCIVIAHHVSSLLTMCRHHALSSLTTFHASSFLATFCASSLDAHSVRRCCHTPVTPPFAH